MKMKLLYPPAFFVLIILGACKKECPKDEVGCTTKLTSGLLAYYPFNGNANDESGNGNTGTVVNGAFFTTDHLGRPNKAAGFDGQNDYIIVQDNGKLTPDKITISLMVLVNNVNRRHTFVNKVNFSNGTAVSYGLGQSLAATNKFDFATANNTEDCSKTYVYDETNIASSPEQMLAGRWYSIIATFENGIQKIYVDGVLKSTLNRNFNTLKKCNTSQFVIGGWWQNDIISIDGKLDEIRVYDRVLTDCELTELSEMWK